jgi:hypothetical protein
VRAAPARLRTAQAARARPPWPRSPGLTDAARSAPPRSSSTRPRQHEQERPAARRRGRSTVTNPKSRSIRMSETTSTANPRDRASAPTRAPPPRSTGRCARAPLGPAARRALRAEALASSTLNSVEIAMTSAPERHRHRVQRDPQGRTGPAPTSRSRQRDRDERDEARASQRRKTAQQGERRRPARPATSAEQAPPRRGHLGVGLGGEHRQARRACAVHAGGGWSDAHLLESPAPGARAA